MVKRIFKPIFVISMLLALLLLPPQSAWAKGAAATPMVSSGSVHSLALKEDGTVWAWGHNDSGQLGDGTASQTTPVMSLINLKETEETSPTPSYPVIAAILLATFIFLSMALLKTRVPKRGKPVETVADFACSSCGHRFQERDRFCENCGSDLR